jgi:hypothetical protein
MAEGEVARVLRALAADEVWERTARGWWRLEAAGGARALVKPTGSGYAWGVEPARGATVQGGRAPTEHEALRAAERALEEHRP